MASVNKVIILGNLGRDPELKHSPSGMAVVNISIATSRRYKKEGEPVEETEWHRVVAYDKLAEVIGKYCTKGKPVYIEGRLKTRKWQDKEGKDQYTTEIVVEQLQLLGGRDEGSSGGGQQRSAAPAPAPAAKGKQQAEDDDIPF